MKVPRYGKEDNIQVTFNYLLHHMEDIKQLSVSELATQLILKRQEAKSIEQQTKEIQDELLNRDFEKETIE